MKTGIVNIFALVVAFYGNSCSMPDVPADLELLVRKQFATEETFLGIAKGVSYDEVRKSLGSAIRHQFTTVDTNGDQVVMVYSYVEVGEGDCLGVLLRNEAVEKIIEPVAYDLEVVPYRDSARSRIKTWDIEDVTRVRKALNAPAVSADQIKQRFKEIRETSRRVAGKGNVPIPVFIAFATALLPKAEKEYALNDQLRQRFNGCRVFLGMKAEEVDDLYGEPLRVLQTSGGLRACIYGDRRYLASVNPQLLFPYVAVVFARNGRASHVYSDQFFCDDWDPEMPVLRRK